MLHVRPKMINCWIICLHQKWLNVTRKVYSNQHYMDYINRIINMHRQVVWLFRANVFMIGLHRPVSYAGHMFRAARGKTQGC